MGVGFVLIGGVFITAVSCELPRSEGGLGRAPEAHELQNLQDLIDDVAEPSYGVVVGPTPSGVLAIGSYELWDVASRGQWA